MAARLGFPSTAAITVQWTVTNGRFCPCWLQLALKQQQPTPAMKRGAHVLGQLSVFQKGCVELQLSRVIRCMSE